MSYIQQQVHSEISNKKEDNCTQCTFSGTNVVKKYTFLTKCCNKKVCESCLRTSDLYSFCNDCFETIMIDKNYFREDLKTIYCKEHCNNNLGLCNVCDGLYCKKHLEDGLCCICK